MQDRYHGIGRYTFELLRELSRHEVHLIVLYSPNSGRLDISELITRSNVQAVASRVPVVSLRSQWELSRTILAFRPDVVFVPYHLSTPLLHGRVPVVSVIHDCIFEHRCCRQRPDGLLLDLRRRYPACNSFRRHAGRALARDRYESVGFTGLSCQLRPSCRTA